MSIKPQALLSDAKLALILRADNLSDALKSVVMDYLSWDEVMRDLESEDTLFDVRVVLNTLKLLRGCDAAMLETMPLVLSEDDSFHSMEDNLNEYEWFREGNWGRIYIPAVEPSAEQLRVLQHVPTTGHSTLDIYTEYWCEYI